MKNIFGTDGIRNSIGNFPFIQNILPELGKAIAAWALNKYGNNVSFIIAQDTRESCSWVKMGLSSGMLTQPVKIFDAQILPTPAVSHMLSEDPRFTCGIVISASHNPFFDNGIKLIDKSGKILLEDELYISHKLANIEDYTLNSLGSYNFIPEAQEKYCSLITKLFKSNFLQNFKIVLDAANGATYEVAPKIFKEFGANIVTINNVPSGRNINLNCGALSLEELQKTVLEHNADIGFAFDGDGDRVIAVNKYGQIKDGDDILALLCSHPAYKDSSVIVGTTMSNHGLEYFLKKQNKKLERTDVGDKFVNSKLSELNMQLGGEQAGHIILKDFLNSGDGILVALRLMESIVYSQNYELKTFDKFPQVLLKLPITERKDLNNPEIKSLIDQYQAAIPEGRILIRYSGTEPLLRVMVEDQDGEKARNISQSLMQDLKQILS